MLQIDMRKIYNFYPVEPAPPADNLPTGGDLYYECTECKVIINSVPHIKSACTCGNLTGAGGEVKIGDTSKVKVVKGKLK